MISHIGLSKIDSFTSGMLAFLFCIFFLLASTTPAHAEAENKPATEQKWRFGNISLEYPIGIQDPAFIERVNELKSNLPVEKGDAFNREAVQEMSRAFFQAGIFSKIEVRGVEDGETMHVRFKLFPKVLVEKLEFIGNEHVEEKDILSVMRLREGDNIFPDEAEKEIKRIKRLYRRRGFLDAEVDARFLSPTPVFRDTLRYRIIEGEQATISKIRFKVKPKRDEAFLRRKFPIEVGDALNVGEIEKGIQTLEALYREAGYREAKLKLQGARDADWQSSDFYQKGEVVIEVSRGKKVEIRFVGNRHYSSRTLYRALKLDDTDDALPFGYGRISKLTEELIVFYKREGYPDVTVQAKVSFPKRRKHLGKRELYAFWKVIQFFIYEGKRVKVERIRFKGAKHLGNQQVVKEFEAFLRERLSTGDESELKPPQFNEMLFKHSRLEEEARRYPIRRMRKFSRPEPLDPDEIYIKEIYEEGVRAIEHYYRENGFLSAAIFGPQLKYSKTGERLAVTYRVHEGVQTIIRSISYASGKEKGRIELTDFEGLKVGRPLNDTKFKTLSKRVKKRFDEKGYIYTRVNLRYVLSANEKFADLHVEIEEGPKVEIGDIFVNGLRKTRRRTVIEELTFEPEDTFKPSEMELSRRWLQKLGIFQAVTLKPWNAEKVEKVKKVLVTVRERPPGRFEISGGIATDEGLRSSLLFKYRNLLGIALEFHLKAKVNHRLPPLLDDQFARYYEALDWWESLERELTVGFYYPSIRGSHIGWRTDITHLRRQERAYGLDKNSFTIAFDTELFQKLTLAQINEFSYLNSERTALKALRANEYIPPAGQSWEYSPKFQAILDYRDSIYSPTKGVVISGLIEYFETITGELNVDLLRTTASISGYVPLAAIKRPPVLKLTGKTGNIYNVSSIDTPVDKRFKLGGRMSIRGFDEEAAYPADLPSEEIELIRSRNAPSPGGNTYLLLKAEIRAPVYKNYYLGVFLDSGNLWIKPKNMDVRVDRYHNSAGVGLHYRTPVGDVSLEMGWNLDPDKRLNEESWRLHFSINLF